MPLSINVFNIWGSKDFRRLFELLVAAGSIALANSLANADGY